MQHRMETLEPRLVASFQKQRIFSSLLFMLFSQQRRTWEKLGQDQKIAHLTLEVFFLVSTFF